MNDGSEREFDDVLLERLVDGELTPAEYRSLLSELDQRPEGWRRCALAFLEDQAWGRELRRSRRELDEPTVKAKPVSRLGSAWNLGGMLMLSSAASFLLAFFVAKSVLQDRSSGNPSPESIARNDVGKPSIPNTSIPNSAVPPHPEVSDPGHYALVVDGNEMPIFDADDPRGRLLLNERASMPVELIRDLRRSGYEVDRRREWAVGGDDGNSVLVPIEELQITPISGRSFQ
jgi:hypothetical protein